jgi:lysyl-tRNA synthetase class 1
MYQKPRAAKRLYFDVIPRAVEDYVTFLDKFPEEAPAQRLENPVWHIHDGKPPRGGVPIGFGILLNLASVAHAEDKAALWSYISRYVPDATPENQPLLDRLVGHALAYYRDFVRPAKRYRPANEMERAALADLLAELNTLPSGASADEIQNVVYAVGKRHAFADLRSWFQALYELLIGQSTGPRMGSFIALYGIRETAALIEKVLAGEDLNGG